jgi:membrane protein
MKSAPLDRVDTWAARRRWRLAGRNPALVASRIARRFVEVRVTGLAAEMTYYVLLSIIPLIAALGAGLGALEGIIGEERVEELEITLIDSIEGVLSTELTRDVAAPLVEALLEEQRTGLAIGGLAVTLWLAGRMFRAAIRALDDTYRVPERRSLIKQWLLSTGFLLGALVGAVVGLATLVVGPLLGGGRRVAEWLGAGDFAETLWDLGRWPLVALLGIGFLTWLYRAGPNVDNRWKDCVPGAVLATLGLLAITVGFRFYLEFAGPRSPEVGDADEAVRIAAQLLGTALAVMLFVWMSNISILSGGVFNAEWKAAATTNGRPPRHGAAAGGSEERSDRLAAPEPAPGAPEEQRDQCADRSDDHQDDPDGVQVDPLDIRSDGETENRADRDQNETG